MSSFHQPSCIHIDTPARRLSLLDAAN